MRKTPLFLAAFFIFVTLSRVSNFSAAMGDKSLSIVFSIGLGAVIFISSYWSQYKGNSGASPIEKDKIKSLAHFSWVILFISVLVDGTFNLADVLSENKVTPFTIIYGITPTLLSLLLGILQAKIDTLPILRTGSTYKIGLSFKKSVTRMFDSMGQSKPKTKPVNLTPKPKTKPLETLSKPSTLNLDNLNETQKAIILAVKENPKVSNVAISETVGITPQAIGKSRRNLIETGTISNNGN